MSLLEQLKSFFDIKIDISKLKAINIFSNNRSQRVTINQTFNINVDKLSEKEIPKIQEMIRSAVKQEGDLLLESSAEKRLEDISVVEKRDENQQLLEYFKGKISASDLEILRASIYIKNVHQRGGDVYKLRGDLIQKYGVRGTNISNLCTAGYFETLIKPLYEELLQQSDFSPEKFTSKFDAIVRDSPFVVFVSLQKSQEELIQEVKRKIEINRKYGIKYLNIHGIGRDNVTKIRELLAELKDQFTAPPEMNSGGIYLNAKIWF